MKGLLDAVAGEVTGAGIDVKDSGMEDQMTAFDVKNVISPKKRYFMKPRAVSSPEFAFEDLPPKKRRAATSTSKCIGAYTWAERHKKVLAHLEKRKHRVYAKQIKYEVRKKFADSRLRVGGRFIKKTVETQLLDMQFLLL